MCDQHLLLTIVHIFSLRFSHPPLPLEGPGRGAGPIVAAQLGVVQEVPHEPDLRNIEAVNNHELLVKTGVKRLQVGRCRGSGNSKGPKALVA